MALWPMGAVVNSGTGLLTYGDCETAGACTAVVGTNNGQLHLVDAATGDEHSALVPGDLWKVGYVTSRPISDLLHQPSLEYKRLPLVDGGTIVYHTTATATACSRPSPARHVVCSLSRRTWRVCARCWHWYPRRR
ncbi:MAG: hypothetical protein HC923_03430 [Myxococcales bacterium]|nr:hypothetical protein [Myxococcales bacterium]